jgi:signal transduction histidine kinase
MVSLKGFYLTNLNLTEGLSELSRRIFFEANQCTPRISFLRKILKMLVAFTNCHVVELQLHEGKHGLRCRVRQSANGKRLYHFSPGTTRITFDRDRSENQKRLELERLTADFLKGRIDPTMPFLTPNGSFFLRDTTQPIDCSFQADGKTRPFKIDLSPFCSSFALFPLIVGPEKLGIIQFRSTEAHFFTPELIQDFEPFIQLLSLALLNQRTQAALTGRDKELTCLSEITRVAGNAQKKLPEILQEMVIFLPPAWQFPEIAAARIVLDGESFTTPGFEHGIDRQTARIVLHEIPRGQVEVVYISRKPHLDEGPFLFEERRLIEAIAGKISRLVAHKQTEKERNRLRDQLPHADRLAIIGQLAAGMAHELNAPLGTILGFAQLLSKNEDLTGQNKLDIHQIVAAAIHAREVMKKLMQFASPIPSQKIPINLNQIVSDGLFFLESRCAREGIELEHVFAADLPEIVGDRSQLYQLLVNLIVNAIQDMPNGGKLTLKTQRNLEFVTLIVEDTGTGMTTAGNNQIFIPFFTPIEAGESCGIGLSVVHGIVTAHGGIIQVQREVGVGTKIEIQLPLHHKNTE